MVNDGTRKYSFLQELEIYISFNILKLHFYGETKVTSLEQWPEWWKTYREIYHLFYCS